jgi:hypothetical protein
MDNPRALLTLAAIALLQACASGGMYDQPYALIQPDQRSATQDTRAAFVLAIDGANRGITDNDPVPPGVRTVKVSVPGERAMAQSIYKTIEIDAKACTRYYLSAKEGVRGSGDWTPFVSFTEPIGECQKKFASTPSAK